MAQPTVQLIWLLATELLAAGSLMGAAAWQHGCSGIQIELCLIAALLLPAHLRRLLALLGRVPHPPTWMLLIELGAVAALRPETVPPLSLGLAVLGGLLASIHPGDPGGPRMPLGHLWVLLTAVVALGVLVRAVHQDRSLASVRFVLLLPLLLEAIVGRDRSARADLRRGSALLLSAAVTLPRVPDAGLELGTSLLLVLWAWLVHAVRNVGPDERARAVRRQGLRTFAPVLVIVLFAAVAELVFRFVPNEYSGLLSPAYVGGPWHVPGKRYLHKGAPLRPLLEPENEVVWNRHGWHDADHELARPPATLRILVLGDSYVEGVQVPLDALYHRRLERELEARAGVEVEVIGYGFSGWGQKQELLALRDGRPTDKPSYPAGLAFDPDLVVVEFLPSNDVRNNLDELEEMANSELFQATFARSLYMSSVRHRLFFNAMVWDKTDQFLRRLRGHTHWIDSEVYREQPRRSPEVWERAWAETARALGEMKSTLAPREVGLVVVGFTAPFEIEHARAPAPVLIDGFDPSFPHRRMARICAGLAIPYLPLPERFARLPAEEREGLHGKGDSHWSALGHRHGAAETAAWLLEQRTVWERALTRSRSAR